MEDKYKELISGSGGLRWQITSFNQQCQVRKTNDVYTEAASRLKTAALAPSPYQSVQARASCSGRPLLWVVRPEASVEHIRNTTGRPSHSCGFWLATALKNLQLQKHGHPTVRGLNYFGCRKQGKHAVLLRSCEAFIPHYQRDRALRQLEVTTLIGDSTRSRDQCYLR